MSRSTNTDPPEGDILRLDQANSATRTGHDRSRRALHVVEYALSAPAPRRERTWVHRLSAAVDRLAESIDRQIADDDNCIGLLAEIALTEPDRMQDVVELRDEQRALRVAIASVREQLDEHPEIPLDIEAVRRSFTELANRYRRHHTLEVELIHTALGIDITEPGSPT